MEKSKVTGDHPGGNSNNGECGWRPCCPDVLLIKVKKE